MFGTSKATHEEEPGKAAKEAQIDTAAENKEIDLKAKDTANERAAEDTLSGSVAKDTRSYSVPGDTGTDSTKENREANSATDNNGTTEHDVTQERENEKTGRETGRCFFQHFLHYLSSFTPFTLFTTRREESERHGIDRKSPQHLRQHQEEGEGSDQARHVSPSEGDTVEGSVWAG